MTLLEAYEIGKELKNKINFFHEVYNFDYSLVENLNDFQLTSMEAGFLGASNPKKVSGYRYGEIPKCGKSYNYREQRPEIGVSIAAMDGDAENADPVSALFYNFRKIITVTGWLNPLHRGSDGEPLLMYCKVK